MIRLNLSQGPQWYDLGHGVRVRAMPMSSSLILAAQRDMKEIDAQDGDVGEKAMAMAKAVARLAITEWEGVADESDQPAPVTPQAVDALLDVWPLFETWQTEYMAPGFLVLQEKKGSAPAPNGTSMGARNTAKPARKRAKTARRG